MRYRIEVTSNQQSERGRVLGIGGIFFKSRDEKGLKTWYGEHLGIKSQAHGAMFSWRPVESAGDDREHLTIWSVFPASTSYFGPGNSPFMINYIVDDLDALLAKMAQAGVRIDPKRDDADFGRFAWIYDPDGNKVELWEPPAA